MDNNAIRRLMVSVSFAFAAAAFSAMAETGLTQDGTVLRFHVEDGDTLRYDEPFSADATAVVKTGVGTLEVVSTNTAFRGPVDIVEGVVKIFHKNALGSSTAANRLTDGAISVSNNAQLATCCEEVGQAGVVLSKRIVLSGSGPGGTGALRLKTQSDWKNQDQYTAHLIVADDTLVVNEDSCRYGFGMTDLKGHELVMTCESRDGQVMFNNTRHLSVGTIRCKKLMVVWQNGVVFEGGSDGRFVVEDATLRLYDGADRTSCPWTLEFAGSATSTLSVNGSWLDVFTGPVEFNVNTGITGNGTVRFLGAAKGPKKLSVLLGMAYFESSLNRSASKIVVGYYDSKGSYPSVLKIGEGAAITNVFNIGHYSKSVGAVHQYGGLVKDSGVSGDLGLLGKGAGGYGYYGIYGGKLSFGRFLRVADGAGSVGIVEVRGGDVTASGGKLNIGNGGWGEIYIADGVLTSQSSIVGVGDGDAGGRVAITLSDGGAQYTQDWGEIMKLTPATNDSVIAVNLNGGTLKSYAMRRSAVAQDSRSPDSRAYLNFNGGTHESYYNSDSLYGTGDTALDRVTIFSGGATIRALSTINQSADTPFLRPTGRGVASISLPEGMENGNYNGPPEVRITGGGGEGATAHAIYDPATRSVTGIEVTCPGWDYETVPKATICSSYRTFTNECVVALTAGEQVSGGLTLEGSNMLNLHAVNTYTGDTVLSGSATLTVAAAGALPADSTVVFAGGELNNKSGVQHKKYAVDCASAIDAGGYDFHNTIDFSNGVTMEVRNMEEFPRDAPRTTLISFMGTVTGVPEFTGAGRFQRIRLIDKKLVVENINGTVFVLR